MQIVIIGAGPTGLGAAYRLMETGNHHWCIFEKHDYVGGLSASLVDGRGFTWDIGGHVLFSHYDYFDRAVGGGIRDAYFEHMRESWIRLLRTWVPYPFQNNIRYLPDDALRECLEGLRGLGEDPKGTANFGEWMSSVFGRGIVKYFMEPYNLKVWGVPLESMSKDWIGERVSVIDLRRIERNIREQRDDVNWGPNNKFKFPKHGGTGAIFEGIARPFREKIDFGHELIRVSLTNREVCFGNGRRVRYDFLINTTPLDSFVERCVDAPEAMRESAVRLVHNGGLIVGLGFCGKRVDPKCWMYFPEDNAPFYRVTNFHNYSPYNVPDGRTHEYFSLMCETTYSSHKTIDKGDITEETIQGLVNSGMIMESDRARIVSRHLIDIPYSYPVPTLGRDAALSVIQPYLESHGVYSRGRFGAWKYEVGNMDHSFMQGVEVIDRILSGGQEVTIGRRH